MVQLPEGVTAFVHINQNEFSGRKHAKQKEEDIAICECRYDANDPDSACGERCLNVLTSTECTPGYCSCGNYCKNQKFQKCVYAKTLLFKTDGRGWGLLADENIKAGSFIIEYCGEVISSEEAKLRSQNYEAQGLKDAYIISLTASSFIDATKKGSLARFINHSCKPNCETRKWTVLGETRVGIFAKRDISAGTELAYNYNFEWYGGTTVRCLCGAPNCSIFLGAKSHFFQEYNHVWEDGDDRYTVDKIPLYDSAEDEPASNFSKASNFGGSVIAAGTNDSATLDGNLQSVQLYSASPVVEPLYSVPIGSVDMSMLKDSINEETMFYPQDAQKTFPQKNAMISRIRSNSACRNYNIGPGSVPKKRSQQILNRKSKNIGQKPLSAKTIAKLFLSKKAQEEIIKYEEIRSEVTAQLSSLHNEIRPAIEEHERDSQDSVPTSVAEKWIEATCSKWKAEFDLYFCVVKNSLFPPQTSVDETKPSGGENENEIKLLAN